MAKILLADDDEYYRSALKSVLKSLGHEITEVGDGKGAQHILGLQPFDLLISDIRMPFFDGIQLLQWAKGNTRTPVILITGFSEILETQQASELGADDFLLKPFKSEDISSAIRKATSTEASSDQVTLDLDEQYCKIPIEDFVSGSKIHSNIFIRISNTRYVKIAHQGEDVAIERIRSYKTRGVRYLYLNREDFKRYVNFNVLLTKKVKEASQISQEKKRNFLRYSAEIVLEQVFVEGADREEFEVTKEFVMTTLSIIQHHDTALAMLISLNNHADFLYAHCLGVSIYSALLARAMGWTSTPVQFKISLAGLLHDVGCKEIPREVLEKSRVAMSLEERSFYETHPTRGMELLNQIQGIPEEVVQVAAQHHEDCSGFGYPKKLSKTKIHPLSRLISIADRFCEIAVRWPGQKNLSAIETIRQMNEQQLFALDAEYFAAFKTVFKFDRLAEMTSRELS